MRKTILSCRKNPNVKLPNKKIQKSKKTFCDFLPPWGTREGGPITELGGGISKIASMVFDFMIEGWFTPSFIEIYDVVASEPPNGLKMRLSIYK